MYFALRDGPRGFTQDFSCPGLLGIQLPNITYFNYGTFTPSGQPFQIGSSISNIQTTLSHYPGLKTGLGILPVRSPLLRESFLFSLPSATKMFQFTPFAFLAECQVFNLTGFPIRISPGLCSLTARRGFSQFATSFFAIWCLGIHLVPFLLSPYNLSSVSLLSLTDTLYITL